MQVKDKILKVARQEFAKHGFRNVRTDELANKLGISKRTLYFHFESKEQLLEEVIDLELETLKLRIDSIISEIENNKEVNVIDELSKMWQIDVDSSLSFTTEFFTDIQKFIPNIWDKIAAFRKKEMEKNFSRIFKVGVERQVFRSNISGELLFLMHLTIIQHLLNPETLMKMNYTPQMVIATIYDVLFKGVLTDEARDYYETHQKTFCTINKSIQE